MSGRWWRAYGRARHDPKLLKLSDRHFRWWFSLVCVASDNGGVLPLCEDLAVEFRVTSKVMTEVLDALVAAGLLDHDETGIHPHNWNVLQYKSDVSNERVKRFRQRQGNVTGNVSVTASETEADTEQKERVPRTGARLPDDWMPSADDRAFAEQLGLNPDTVAPSFKDYWRGVAGAKGRKADWPGTWRNWCRREAENPKRAGGFAKPADLACVTVDRDGESQWRARMRGYGPDKLWPNDWGPRPGQPGCRVPPSLLATWRQGAEA